jgi:hypothetical protein
MKQFIAALGIGFCSQAFGSWISGGGSMDYTANNPWFLNNTSPIVEYCVFVDPENFGMTKEEITPAILEALNFWKAEIRELADHQGQGQQIGLQDFRPKGQCDINDETIDLKFQFGILTEEQSAWIKDPRDFAGLTVRTTYDAELKRGRGFIYIGPERGPSQIAHTIDKPWSNFGSGLLKHVLAHEVSHILGIAHYDNIPLLSSRFILDILSSEGAARTKSVQPLDYQILHFEKAVESLCSGAEIYGPFFGVPSYGGCYRFLMTQRKLEVYYSSDNVEWSLIGQAEWVENHQLDADLWVPFRLNSNPYSSLYIAPWVENLSLSGTYVSTDGKVKRPMHFRRIGQDNKLRLTGSFQGRIYPDLLNLPPLLPH